MIDVLSPISSAIKRTEQILFSPFSGEKWAALAFAVFLISPLNSGFSINFPVGNSFHPPSGDANYHQVLSQIQAFFTPVVIIIALIFFAFAIGLGIVVSWLSVRGQFILLDNIVWNRGQIVEPWQKYASQANRLWLFNLAVSLTSLIFMMTLVGVPVAFILTHGGDFLSFLVPLISLGCVFLIVYIPLCIVLGLFFAFGVPIMYRNGVGPWMAFKMSTSLLRKDPIGILLMGLVIMMIGLASMILIGILSFCTFCIFACVLVIPIVGSLVGAFLLLPLTVFYRCYLLDVLAQFGPEYDVWAVSNVHPPATSSFR